MRGMKDSPNLDLLRSVAVGLVLLSHAPDFFDGVAFAFNFKAVGRLGVALFFVHTTLVLMLSIERHGESATAFLVRRFFRIYPLAVAAVLVMAALLWIGNAPLGAGEFASNLLLIQNLTGHRSWPQPLWSLPYEVQMYLVLPALYAVTRARPALIAAIYLAALAIAASMWSVSWPVLLIGFIPCFLPGAIAFLLLRRVRAVLSPWVLFAVVAAAIALASQLSVTDAQEVPYFWAICLAVGLTIPFCRELTFRPLALASGQVARYSYGIYLTHVLAMGLTLMGSDPWYIRLALFAFAQAVLAVLAYRLIEAPGIRLGARLAALVTRMSEPRSRSIQFGSSP